MQISSFVRRFYRNEKSFETIIIIKHSIPFLFILFVNIRRWKLILSRWNQSRNIQEYIIFKHAYSLINYTFYHSFFISFLETLIFQRSELHSFHSQIPLSACIWPIPVSRWGACMKSRTIQFSRSIVEVTTAAIIVSRPPCWTGMVSISEDSMRATFRDSSDDWDKYEGGEQSWRPRWVDGFEHVNFQNYWNKSINRRWTEFYIISS